MKSMTIMTRPIMIPTITIMPMPILILMTITPITRMAMRTTTVRIMTTKITVSMTTT